MLAAEKDALPAPVNAAVAGFFRMLLDYLRAAQGEAGPGDAPEAVIARLEGALILARSLDDRALFETVAGGA